MKTKKEIREDIQKLFQDRTREELEENSNIIVQKLKKVIQKWNYKKICIYEHMQDEVYTHKIISDLRQLTVEIYTPQIISETEMILIDHNYEHYEQEIEFFILPWRAFSLDWKRLWRWKWYYDRFLSQKIYKKSQKIWICYDFQILENIPIEKHDVLLNKIITNATS